MDGELIKDLTIPLFTGAIAHRAAEHPPHPVRP
jgi:hypothetical protein